MHKNYITQKIIMAISIVLAVGMVILNLAMPTGRKPDRVFGMVNSGIEWTGAGYNGIYEGVSGK